MERLINSPSPVTPPSCVNRIGQSTRYRSVRTIIRSPVRSTPVGAGAGQGGHPGPWLDQTVAESNVDAGYVPTDVNCDILLRLKFFENLRLKGRRTWERCLERLRTGCAPRHDVGTIFGQTR